MNQYEELIYSLIANCNREITKEEKKILNQASAIYNTYNRLTEQLGCPLEVLVKALENGIYTKESELDKKLELFEVRGIELRGLGVISNICSYGECDFTCYYTDYKKTWFLKEDRSE